MLPKKHTPTSPEEGGLAVAPCPRQPGQRALRAGADRRRRLRGDHLRGGLLRGAGGRQDPDRLPAVAAGRRRDAGAAAGRAGGSDALFGAAAPAAARAVHRLRDDAAGVDGLLARPAAEADPAAGRPQLQRDAGERLEAPSSSAHPALGRAVEPARRAEAVGRRRSSSRRCGRASSMPWQLWIVPLLAWGVFVALMFTALSLPGGPPAPAVGGQREARLSAGPAAAGDDPGRGRGGSGPRGQTGSFLKNRLTWIGFALPALLFGFNGLHQYVPELPGRHDRLDLNDFFTAAALERDGLLPHLSLVRGHRLLLPAADRPAVLALVLLSVDEAGGGGRGGARLPAGDDADVRLQDCSSATRSSAAIWCWSAICSTRPARTLARVWRAATRFGGRRGARMDGRRTNCSPTATAFWGLVVSVLLSAGWLTMLGMSYWLALFELVVLLFVVALVMARSTCEVGMLMTETSFRPIDIYRMVGDVRNLGAANLTGLAFLDGLWMRDQRGLLLTGFLELDEVRRRRARAAALAAGRVRARAGGRARRLRLSAHLAALPAGRGADVQLRLSGQSGLGVPRTRRRC